MYSSGQRLRRDTPIAAAAAMGRASDRTASVSIKGVHWTRNVSPTAQETADRPHKRPDAASLQASPRFSRAKEARWLHDRGTNSEAAQRGANALGGCKEARKRHEFGNDSDGSKADSIFFPPSRAFSPSLTLIESVGFGCGPVLQVKCRPRRARPGGRPAQGSRVSPHRNRAGPGGRCARSENPGPG